MCITFKIKNCIGTEDICGAKLFYLDSQLTGLPIFYEAIKFMEGREEWGKCTNQGKFLGGAAVI